MECSRMRLSVSTPSTSISTSRILAARFRSADEIFRLRLATAIPSAPRLPRDVCGGNQRGGSMTKEGPQAVWPYPPPKGGPGAGNRKGQRSEEHTPELQSRPHLLCRLLL